jgi:hypothetical protein
MPAMMDVEDKGVERNRREMSCGAKFLPGLARMSPAFLPADFLFAAFVSENLYN